MLRRSFLKAVSLASLACFISWQPHECCEVHAMIDKLGPNRGTVHLPPGTFSICGPIDRPNTMVIGAPTTLRWPE